jgi:hypothetical protein
MFKSSVMGSVTLALLTNNAQAVKYRPPPGATPWYKKASLGENEDPKYPYNYVVPNFGEDTDIKMSKKHLGEAEKKIGKPMAASFKQPKGHPVDYKVPNFGMDTDIKMSLGNIAQSEANLKHKWVPPTKAQIKAGQHPTDYFVPNFGQDSDIKTSLQNTNDAEKLLKKKWVPPTKAQVKAGQHPTDYFVPNFGIDEDIKITQKNIAASEKSKGHKWNPVKDGNGVWLVPGLVQTESDIKIESDPICSSAGCNYASEKGTKTHPMNYFVPNFGRDREINHSFDSLDWAESKLNHKWVPPTKSQVKAGQHPMDYFVPNFGVDDDIKMTQANVAEQEKVLGHEWVPVQDENGVWIVPTANKPVLLQTESEINLESDPVCSSAGCNYASQKPPKGHPVDYFVPNFGRDQDINSTWASLDWAESKHQHRFNPISKEEAKKLEHPVDYPIPDFGLDEEVVVTQANIAE